VHGVAIVANESATGTTEVANKAFLTKNRESFEDILELKR